MSGTPMYADDYLKRKKKSKLSTTIHHVPIASLCEEPVLGSVACAVLPSLRAAVAGASYGGNAVDILGANGAFLGTEVQPADGTSALDALVSLRRGGDGVKLGGEEVDLLDSELRNTLAVEEVVAREGKLNPVDGDGSVRCEGRDEGAGSNGPLRFLSEVEGNIVVVKRGHGKPVESVYLHAAFALSGVERCDVVEHGQSTGGSGLGAFRLAGVVLNAKAESNVLECCVARRLGKFLCYQYS